MLKALILLALVGIIAWGCYGAYRMALSFTKRARLHREYDEARRIGYEAWQEYKDLPDDDPYSIRMKAIMMAKAEEARELRYQMREIEARKLEDEV